MFIWLCSVFYRIHSLLRSNFHGRRAVFSTSNTSAQCRVFQFRYGCRIQFRRIFQTKHGCQRLICLSTSTIPCRFNLLLNPRRMYTGSLTFNSFNNCLMRFNAEYTQPNSVLSLTFSGRNYLVYPMDGLNRITSKRRAYRVHRVDHVVSYRICRSNYPFFREHSIYAWQTKDISAAAAWNGIREQKSFNIFSHRSASRGSVRVDSRNTRRSSKAILTRPFFCFVLRFRVDRSKTRAFKGFNVYLNITFNQSTRRFSLMQYLCPTRFARRYNYISNLFQVRSLLRACVIIMYRFINFRRGLFQRFRSMRHRRLNRLFQFTGMFSVVTYRSIQPFRRRPQDAFHEGVRVTTVSASNYMVRVCVRNGRTSINVCLPRHLLCTVPFRLGVTNRFFLCRFRRLFLSNVGSVGLVPKLR